MAKKKSVSIRVAPKLRDIIYTLKDSRAALSDYLLLCIVRNEIRLHEAAEPWRERVPAEWAKWEVDRQGWLSMERELVDKVENFKDTRRPGEWTPAQRVLMAAGENTPDRDRPLLVGTDNSIFENLGILGKGALVVPIGRPKGRKDSIPRVRRTKADLKLAGVKP